MYFLVNHLNGINLGIEFCGACLLLLLLTAINMKKKQSEEMHYYKAFVISNVISLLADISAYLVTGNKDLTMALLITSILSYTATGFSVFYFYTYLQSHYNERYEIPYSKRNFKIIFAYVAEESYLLFFFPLPRFRLFGKYLACFSSSHFHDLGCSGRI